VADLSLCEEFVRQVGAGHGTKWRERRRKPRRAAANFDDLQVGATLIFQPLADDLALPAGNFVQLNGASFCIPLIPKTSLLFAH